MAPWSRTLTAPAKLLQLTPSRRTLTIDHLDHSGGFSEEIILVTCSTYSVFLIISSASDVATPFEGSVEGNGRAGRRPGLPMKFMQPRSPNIIMPSQLSPALAPPARPPLSQPLLLLQSSAAQTCLPVLRAVVQQTAERAREALVLFCFLYPPSSFLDPARLTQGDERVRIVDRTSNVPGYDIDSPESSEDEWKVHLKTAVIEAARAGAPLLIRSPA